MAKTHGVPVTKLGRTGGGALAVASYFDVDLATLRSAWTATLPAVLS